MRLISAVINYLCQAAERLRGEKKDIPMPVRRESPIKVDPQNVFAFDEHPLKGSTLRINNVSYDATVEEISAFKSFLLGQTDRNDWVMISTEENSVLRSSQGEHGFRKSLARKFETHKDLLIIHFNHACSGHVTAVPIAGIENNVDMIKGLLPNVRYVSPEERESCLRDPEKMWAVVDAELAGEPHEHFAAMFPPPMKLDKLIFLKKEL